MGPMRTAWLAAVVVAVCMAVPAWAHDPAPSPAVEWVDPKSAEAQGSALNMVAVGHDDLGGRGYNADVWIHEQYALRRLVGLLGLGLGLQAAVLPERRRRGRRHAQCRATAPGRDADQPAGDVGGGRRRGHGAVRAAGGSRHRGRRHPGVRRRPHRHELLPRAAGLRRHRSGSTGRGRPARDRVLHARTARAGGPAPRRSGAHVRVRQRARRASTASRGHPSVAAT